MGDLGWIINTGVLIFLIGLLIAYGRWVAVKIMDIRETLASYGPRLILVDRHEEKIADLSKALAVHCAGPHCGEEKRAEGPPTR